MDRRLISLVSASISLLLVVVLATGVNLSNRPTGASAAADDPPAVIAFDPPLCMVGVGQVFTLNLCISNVSDLYLWVVTVEWSASILSLQSYAEGPFLKQGGRSTTIMDKGTPPGKIIELTCTVLGPVSGVSGSGTLVTFTFTATAHGTTPITITFSDLLDSAGEPIAHTVVNGMICP